MSVAEPSFLREKRKIQSLVNRSPALSAEEFLFTTPKPINIEERFCKKFDLR